METTIMENQMEKNMKNEMETTTLYRVYIGVILGEWKIKWRLLHYYGLYRYYIFKAAWLSDASNSLSCKRLGFRV